MSSAKWRPFCLGLNVLTFWLRRPEYSGRTGSKPWLLGHWLISSPGHQHPWYWPWRMVWSLSSIRTVYSDLDHLQDSDVIMGTMASQITSLTIDYSTFYSGTDHRSILHDDVIKRKHFSRYWPFVLGIHQSPVNSASLAFVWGIHRWLVNSQHKWPVTRKMCPFDDVVMQNRKIIENNNIFHISLTYSVRTCYGLIPSIGGLATTGKYKWCMIDGITCFNPNTVFRGIWMPIITVLLSTDEGFFVYWMLIGHLCTDGMSFYGCIHWTTEGLCLIVKRKYPF